MRRGRCRASVAALSCVAVLHFDRGLREPNTWHMNETANGIHARIRVAGANEVTVEILLRFRAGKAPGLVFVRCLDTDTFHTEAAIIHDDTPRLELVLRRAPEETAAILRGL
jgi:hypothetical protein